MYKNRSEYDFSVNLPPFRDDKLICVTVNYLRDFNMGIQNWSDEIILINLGKEPQMGEELQTAIDLIEGSSCRDIVLDFSDVDIITSSSIAKMLKLRKELVARQSRLVFCSVSAQTMHLFKVVALDTVFEFAENQFVALASLQMATIAK